MYFKKQIQKQKQMQKLKGVPELGELTMAMATTATMTNELKTIHEFLAAHPGVIEVPDKGVLAKWQQGWKKETKQEPETEQKKEKDLKQEPDLKQVTTTETEKETRKESKKEPTDTHVIPLVNTMPSYCSSTLWGVFLPMVDELCGLYTASMIGEFMDQLRRALVAALTNGPLVTLFGKRPSNSLADGFMSGRLDTQLACQLMSFLFNVSIDYEGNKIDFYKGKSIKRVTLTNVAGRWTLN